MNELVPAFEKSILDPSLEESLSGIGELGIDSVLNSSLPDSIPIIGLIKGVCKTAINIHERNLLRQLAAFINAFNDGSVPAEKVEAYKKRLDDNPKFAEKELGRIIIILNSNIDIEKSEFLAKFFKSYINQDIDWDIFCELSDITTQLFLSDLELLFRIFNGEIADTSQCSRYQSKRLSSIGLIDSIVQGVFSFESKYDTDENLKISDIGNTFCTIVK